MELMRMFWQVRWQVRWEPHKKRVSKKPHKTRKESRRWWRHCCRESHAGVCLPCNHHGRRARMSVTVPHLHDIAKVSFVLVKVMSMHMQCTDRSWHFQTRLLATLATFPVSAAACLRFRLLVASFISMLGAVECGIVPREPSPNISSVSVLVCTCAAHLANLGVWLLQAIMTTFVSTGLLQRDTTSDVARQEGCQPYGRH